MEFLTPQQISEFQDVFSAFNTNGDGLIDHKELGVMLRSIGMEVTEAETQDMIADVDVDGSGRLDFREFLNLMISRLRDTDITGEREDAFQDMDKDGDGAISSEDLQQVAKDLGLSLPKKDLEEMVMEASLAKDGLVSEDDFEKLLASN